MTEQIQKVKAEWITEEFSFRAKCPKCGRLEVFQFNRAREAYQGNVCERWLKDSDIEPSRTERFKAFLTRKKELPETPLSIDTLIESSRTHVPGNPTGSLAQGQITTRNTLAFVLMGVRRERTPEEIQFLINHLEELRANAGIRSYIDNQNPWVGYTWEKLIALIERYKNAQDVSFNSPKITQARAEALSKYTFEKTTTGKPSTLDHSITEKAVERQAKIREKTGSSELAIIPPKERAGDNLGGTTELFRDEMKEHSKFSAQHEKNLTEFYENLGISDLTLDCPHLLSRDSPQGKDCIVGLRDEVICNQCGKPTARAKIMEQVKP